MATLLLWKAMPANLRKLMGEKPRPLELMAKESRDSPAPIGQQPIGWKEQQGRLEPLMGLIASGDIPLDDTSARAIKTYIDGMDQRAR